ncbi:hypothetical protein DEIPH_ctg026orf0042 [Deinococcus phoenicis]|uniref:Right handed beta helix domain-containing protein n=1 Tax=Deinococcus phoenicis TaxID=1476583 RepID=A0A016QQ91_9DEIO|nr:hypothetical protein [Deinococcus phoenicis]EYB68141.1 hypothetical protein DEIPH_ctg026orf0042 [Deinococcus phoenicis]
MHRPTRDLTLIKCAFGVLGLTALLAACGQVPASSDLPPTTQTQAGTPTSGEPTETAAQPVADSGTPATGDSSPADDLAARGTRASAAAIDVACDSVSDDLSAIRSKLAAKSVVTLSGTCRIGSSINLAAGKTLAGGRLVATTPLQVVVNATGAGATIRDLIIDGARSKNGILNNGYPITVSNVETMNLTDFGIWIMRGTGSRISGFKAHDINGLVGASAVLVRLAPKTVVENVTAWNIMPPDPNNPNTQPPDGNGVFIGAGSDGTTVTNVTGNNIGRRLVKIQSNYITVRGVYATGVGHSAVQIQLPVAAGGPIRGCRLYDINHTATRNGQYGVMFEDAVDDCVVDGFNFTGMTDTGIEIRGGITNTTFKNGTVKNAARWCVRVENSSASGTRNITFDNVTFDHCYNNLGPAFAIRNNSTYGAVDNVTLNGSRFLNSSIALEAYGSGHVFTNNSFGNAQVKIIPGTRYTAYSNTGVNGSL